MSVPTQPNKWHWSIHVVGILILAAGVTDILLLISLSAVDLSAFARAAENNPGLLPDVHELYLGINLRPEQIATAMIFLSGALGAFIHAATSFGYHMKNGTLGTERIWWYLLRMPIGAALGWILVGVLKSSLVADTSTTQFNMYGLMSTAALAGMFSKQAIDKLAQIFDGILKSEGEDSKGKQDTKR